jgi:predicted membrane protein
MDNEQNIEPSRRRGRGKGRIWGGLILLGIGALLLMRQTGVYIPNWVFTWQMLLIVIGIFSGIKDRFRGGGWIIMILIGGIFMYDRFDPTINLFRFMWPVILISIGLLIILKPGRYRRWHHGRRFREGFEKWHQSNTNIMSSDTEQYSKEDYLDITSIFGGVKKIVVSKNFKGGDITNFMGGTEINFSQADIQGTVVLDTTNIFGGAKLVVPASWEVKTETTAIFGGIEDKRDLHTLKPDANKVLIIDGTCIFGGIEIRSF